MPNTHVPAAGEAMPAAEVMPIIGRFSRRGVLVGLASLPAVAGAAAAVVPPKALTLQQKADAVWQAAEALKQAMTNLHGVPCKIGMGSDTDCILVMTKSAVRP